MQAITTKQPITSINASPHPQATRVKKEEYLTYDYPCLTLLEDFSDGMARKTKYFLVLKEGYIPKGGQDTYFIERGSQQHNTFYSVNYPDLEDEWFSSPFVVAKTISDQLQK